MNQGASKNEQDRIQPAPASALAPAVDCATLPSVSNTNRQRLQELYVKGGYSSVKFWVSPNAVVSEDECIAEVADALEGFQRDKAAGKLNPVGDDVTC